MRRRQIAIGMLNVVWSAVFLTVLHRLVVSGSDRACEYWRDDYRLDGVGKLDLHHLYRAMAWLGEELPASDQADRTLAPRCIKDLIEGYCPG